MSLVFNKKQHIYRLNGVVVPGVTEIITDLLPYPFQATKWHLLRGSKVHNYAAKIARGEKLNCDDRLLGHIEGIKKFFDEVKPRVIDVEQQVYSSRYQYAGTYDLYAEIGGKICLVDYKNSLNYNRVALQLAGYSVAHKDEIRWGMGVQIKDNGKYTMTDKPIRLRPFEREFLAMRSVYEIRKRLGVN